MLVPAWVSSELARVGRITLQVWDIAGGSWQGINLKGLQMAVLESSTENLAVPTARAEQAIVYFPENANAKQRDALRAWLRSRDSQLATAKITTRIVPISLTSSAEIIYTRHGAPCSGSRTSAPRVGYFIRWSSTSNAQGQR